MGIPFTTHGDPRTKLGALKTQRSGMRVRCAAASLEPGGSCSSFDEMAAQLDEMAQRLDAPPPMRQMETSEEVAERRAKKARELKKATAVRAAGGVARERLSQRSGPQRSTLFDGDDWREQTSARSRAMEATLSHLYKPLAGAYWTAQRNGTQPPVRRVHSQALDLVPSYATALPTALSLAQPAFRAMDELHGADPAEHVQSGQGGAEVFEPFDPMAAPLAFHRDFKVRARERAPRSERAMLRACPLRAVPRACSFRAVRSPPNAAPPTRAAHLPLAPAVAGARQHLARRRASGAGCARASLYCILSPRIHPQRAAASAAAEGEHGRARAEEGAGGAAAAPRVDRRLPCHLPHLPRRRRRRPPLVGAAACSVGRVTSRAADVGRRAAAVKTGRGEHDPYIRLGNLCEEAFSRVSQGTSYMHGALSSALLQAGA